MRKIVILQPQTRAERGQPVNAERTHEPIDFAGGDSRFSKIPCVSFKPIARLIKAKTFKRSSFFLIKFLIVCSLSLIIQRDVMDGKVLAKRISFLTDWSMVLLLSPATVHLCIRAAVHLSTEIHCVSYGLSSVYGSRLPPIMPTIQHTNKVHPSIAPRPAQHELIYS